MVGTDRLTVGGCLARFAFALLVAGASDNVATISWIGLFSVATILAVGMSWSHVRRGRATTPS